MEIIGQGLIAIGKAVAAWATASALIVYLFIKHLGHPRDLKP